MGFSLKEFYCCGKLKYTSISLTPTDWHKCDKDKDVNGCCNNTYQFFKVKDKHITADPVKTPFKYFVDLDLYTPLVQDISFASQKPSIAYRSHAPPLHTGVPIYIYNCIFRI